jgi:U3 small nucleolar RNA-associated protein 12
MWHSPGHTSPVTQLAAAASSSSAPSSSTAPPSSLYAVGYHDGSLRLWAFAPAPASSTHQREATEVVCFNGHKKAVTALGWDADASRVASGGTEGEIVVWDVGEERGLVRYASQLAASSASVRSC